MNFKWLLIGGGVAAILFKDQIGALLTGANTYAPATPAPEVIPPTPPPAPIAMDANSTRARLLAAVQKDGYYIDGKGSMAIDRWNYYYQQVRGISGPDPSVLGISDRNMLLTFDEYWNAMTSHGLGRAPASRVVSNPWGRR